MKKIWVAWILVCLSGCRDADPPSDVTKDETSLGPILEDVPIVPFYSSSRHHIRDVLNLRIDHGEVVYLWFYQIVGTSWEEVIRFFKTQNNQNPSVLRVWATPETQMMKVKSEVKRALKAGSSQVNFVVKRNDSGNPVGSLSLDLSHEDDFTGELQPMIVCLDQAGSTLIEDHTGLQEKIVELATLSDRLALHKSAAEMSSSKAKISFRVSDTAKFGRFCEVLSYLKSSSDDIAIIEYERPVKVPQRFQIPRLPVAPKR